MNEENDSIVEFTKTVAGFSRTVTIAIVGLYAAHAALVAVFLTFNALR